MRKVIVQLILICSLVVFVSTCSQDKECTDSNKTNGGKTMEPDKMNLPFNLTKAELPKVEVFYAFYSAKTGAGKQEITIYGTGKVSLFLTKTRDDTPLTKEGEVEAIVLIRLLELMEEQGFMGFQDHYPTDSDPHVRRVLRLTLPNQTKTVMLDKPGFPAFEVLAGGIKLAASLAVPEALKHRFFSNL